MLKYMQLLQILCDCFLDIQGDNSTRPPIEFYEICYTINNKSVCMVTNHLFIVINESTFSRENLSFTLIANNLYGNTTLYNNFISRFYAFNSLFCHYLFYIAVSDYYINGRLDNCGHTSTINKINVLASILVTMSFIYF